MMKRTRNLICLILLVMATASCGLTTAKLEFNRAERAKKEKDYKTAIKYFVRVIKRQPNTEIALKASKQAAYIAHFEAHDYKKAVSLYRYVVVNSKDLVDIKNAQRNLADLYFSRILDYKKAIEEYSKLLQIQLSEEEITEIKIKIAKAYFSLNNFYQADIEIDALLDGEISREERYELLLFKANTLMTLKKHKAAVKVYDEIIKTFPQKSLKENVFLSLSVCYEEMNEFDKAIKVLTDRKNKYPDPEFLDQKIQRLKLRKANLPGARGRVR